MEPLKNMYNDDFFNRLTTSISQVYSSFSTDEFMQLVLNDNWETYELKERMRHITHCLYETFPKNYEDSLEILLRTAPNFTGFQGMIFPDFVEVYGLNHWHASIHALEEFTKYSSSEFAVRPFIKKDSKKMIKKMLEWANSDNVHVRRLASEGCRPSLPWADALPEFKKEPSKILPILEKLKEDEEEYVRKSVANNLNDISKTHPKLLLELAKNWYGKNKNTDWIVKHACRTLLKSGDRDALKIFGFEEPTFLELTDFTLEKENISIGEDLWFHFKINSKRKGNYKIRLEYGIYFLRLNGSYSKKVFKLSEKNYDGRAIDVVRKHSFKKISTRTYYEGIQKISIIINGKELEIKQFKLLK